MQEKISNLLQNDPLYAVLRDTPLEETLYMDSYLLNIIEKKFYSTNEIANWFDITDAQLRYYIKPFEYYIFGETNNNLATANVIRLNFLSILKLRMILLLKDKYHVKGIKQLLSIEGIINNQTAATTLALSEKLNHQVKVLSTTLQEIIQTGLFQLQQDDKAGTISVTINQDYLVQNTELFSIKQMNDIQDQIKQIEKQPNSIENHACIDIAVRMREHQIKVNVNHTLHNEALHIFMSQNKQGIFSKIFRSTQFEFEKQQFIEAYIEQHLPERLLTEFHKYNGIEHS